MITVSRISKSFDGVSFAVKDVSFEVHTGETFVVLGSSGSGKTTTLKMINRLIEPTSGVIEINGQEINTLDPVVLRRSIGYVFQGIGLFPHLSVEENIAIVLKLNNTPKEKQHREVQKYLNLVNLDPEQFAARYPAELSGGQQQRVGVARALVSQSDILLMDEPFGALDAVTRNVLQEELLALQTKIKKSIIFVTHDIFEALRLGNRIAVFNKGKIEQIGAKKEIIMHPATEYVEQLFKQTAKQLNDYKELIDESA